MNKKEIEIIEDEGLGYTLETPEKKNTRTKS